MWLYRIEHRRGRSIAISATAALLVLSGCDAKPESASSDATQPDEGKNIITQMLSGASVTLNPSSAVMPPKGYDCFDDGNQKTTMIFNFVTPDGGHDTLKLDYKIDQVAALETLYPIHAGNAVWRKNYGDMGTMTCFAPSIHARQVFFYGNYEIPLGTLHIQSVTFVNDFKRSETEMRSYKVVFVIDQSRTTGQGHLGTYDTACLVGKDQVHNVWVFQGCQ